MLQLLAEAVAGDVLEFVAPAVIPISTEVNAASRECFYICINLFACLLHCVKLRKS